MNGYSLGKRIMRVILLITIGAFLAGLLLGWGFA